MADEKIEIPEDLKPDYVMTSNPDEAWGPTFVRELIERIAALEGQIKELKSYQLNYEHATAVERAEFEAQIARLKAPVSDKEWERCCKTSSTTVTSDWESLCRPPRSSAARAESTKEEKNG